MCQGEIAKIAAPKTATVFFLVILLNKKYDRGIVKVPINADKNLTLNSFNEKIEIGIVEA
jgi:hypothetical protein